MTSAQPGKKLVVRAPAKVNLFLEVLGKRPDGYHDIATLMVAVNLHDTLEFRNEPSGEVTLTCDHPGLSTGPDNLVSRAAALLRQRYPGPQGARIRLRKKIPMAAGLAGGSTDAAATLVGLNRLWQLNLAPPELMALAAELGSDVPFFLAGAPAAWCTGRGEKVEPLMLGKTLWLVLVCPEVGLATAEVYRRVTVPDVPQTGDAIRRAVQKGDVKEIGRRLHNRLEPAAQQLCPDLAGLHRRLEQAGAAGQLMSGSGSSHFALGRSRREAQRLARELRHDPARLWAGSGLKIFLVHSGTDERRSGSPPNNDTVPPACGPGVG